MIPVHIKISGFLSYQDPIDLDFTSFDLACISGANGAGKSSILDAITWALFGQARRRDDAIINSHTNSAEVIFDFEYEGGLYRVQRGKTRDKPTLIEFFIHDEKRGWRTLSERSLRETDERIQSTLRLDFETFTNASFFLQGKADQFAQQRPGDRKRILSNILGLDIWEKYHERATDRRKTQENELYGLNSSIDEITSELGEENQRRDRLAALEKDLGQIECLRKEKEKSYEAQRALAASLAEKRRLVDMLAAQLLATRQRQEQRISGLQERLKEQQIFQKQIDAADDIEAAYKHWQQLRADLQRWEEIAVNFRQYDAQHAIPLLAIEKERARLEQDRRAQVEQETGINQSKSQLPQLMDSLKNTQVSILQMKAKADEKSDLEVKLRMEQETQTHCQAENKHLKGLMTELKERIERLNDTSGALCPICGQPLSPDDRQKLIDNLINQGKSYGDQYRANQDLMLQTETTRREIETEIVEITTAEENLRQLHRSFDQLTDRKNQLEEIINQWNTIGLPRLAEINQILEEDNYAHEARIELRRIETAMKEVGYDPSAHESIRKSEYEQRSIEERYRLLENARAALAPLLREVAGLREQVAADEQEIITQESKLQEAELKYSTDAASLPDLKQGEAELLTIKEQENHLRLEVGGARQSVEVLKNLRTRLGILTTQKEEKSQLIGYLKTLERSFSKDGIPALLIEQALPEIEAQANIILDRLSPHGMSVAFSTQKEYKDKNREDKKETLEIIISDPAGTREYELYSGGETFRVNFAIRLALSRVLSQRAGARLQTLVIDEGFGSQDADGRQRLVEAINLVQQDFAKILVITHLEELKDYFPARIEVEKNTRGSFVRVIT